MGLIRKIFGLPAATRPLPPTAYGYQPPAGALATGWHCTDDGCGSRRHYDQPQSTVPARCPTCLQPASPLLAWPWQHYAERVRLDRLAAQASSEANRPFGSLVHLDSLVWTYTDLLLQGRNNEARKALGVLDKELRARSKKSPEFIEAPHRFLAVLSAINAGHAASAGPILRQWLSYANQREPGYELLPQYDYTSYTNHQALIDAGLIWLESSPGEDTLSYRAIMAEICAIARQPHVIGYLSASQPERLQMLNPHWQTAP
jgi:hypothetical protein